MCFFPLYIQEEQECYRHFVKNIKLNESTFPCKNAAQKLCEPSRNEQEPDLMAIFHGALPWPPELSTLTRQPVPITTPAAPSSNAQRPPAWADPLPGLGPKRGSWGWDVEQPVSQLPGSLR